jgi:hypothetical protein
MPSSLYISSSVDFIPLDASYLSISYTIKTKHKTARYDETQKLGIIFETTGIAKDVIQ